MGDVMTYHAVEWPHGVRCARCDQPFTEGEVMAEQLDGFAGDTPVVVVMHRACESRPDTEGEQE
jgi:hypothetical protein